MRRTSSSSSDDGGGVAVFRIVAAVASRTDDIGASRRRIFFRGLSIAHARSSSRDVDCSRGLESMAVAVELAIGCGSLAAKLVDLLLPE